MKVLIIEDEKVAAQRLQLLLKAYDPAIDIVAIIESIEETVAWLNDYPHPELMLLDIHLADGFCFEIFRRISYKKPIIFTTAYNEYALDAFKYLSIDYLVKPVTFNALETALNKYKEMTLPVPNYEALLQNNKPLLHEQYKERFLVKIGQKFVFIKTKDVAFFKAEDKLAFLIDKKSNRFMIDYTLDKLETLLDPRRFFRLNRKIIVCIDSIVQVKPYANNRLQLQLLQDYLPDDLIVSRERVADFRNWAEQ